MLGTLLGTLAVQYATWRWAFYLVRHRHARGIYGVCSWPAAQIPPSRRGGTRAAIRSRRRCLALCHPLRLALGLSHLHGGEKSFSGGWLYHLTLFGVSVYCLIAFLIVERRVTNPLVPLRISAIALFSGHRPAIGSCI